eukprot:9725921-Alexandrium_andersonii.AAC.1
MKRGQLLRPRAGHSARSVDGAAHVCRPTSKSVLGRLSPARDCSKRSQAASSRFPAVSDALR